MKCFVPSCPNTKSNSPNKLFVPITQRLQEEWCRQVHAQYYKSSLMYCCEDHLYPEDIRNYHKCKQMKDILPKLAPNAKLRNIVTVDKESVLCDLLLDPTVQQPKRRKLEDSSLPSTSASTLPVKVNASTQCIINMVDKSTNTKCKDTTMATCSSSISVDESSTKLNESLTSPSMFGWTSETETTTVETKKELTIREEMLNIIHKKPKTYLGIPQQYSWLLNHIVEKSNTKISTLGIIITLYKIKTNDTFDKMCDIFVLSRTKITNLFIEGLEALANYFQHFIFLPSPTQIKKTLPLVFKIRYAHVQLILDCFEIQIEKPQNPLTQAQTWSQYKQCNTVKYLIGCTPSGFVSFISEGYGGRISDKGIVVQSNLIDILPINAVIMADRGFKEIESLLVSKNIVLLRPPSVYTNIKPSQQEVLESKTIASLRIHIERVIRRVREFRFLKPHSEVHHKHVVHLDHVVTIACGLVNLQKDIIKKQ